MSAMTVVAENEPTASDAPSPVAKSEAAAPPPATKPPAVAAAAAEPAAKPPAAAASKPQAKPAKSSGSNGGGTRRQGLNGKVKSMREPTKPSVSERLGKSHSTVEPGMTDSQATAARIRKEEEAEAAEHGTFQPQKASSMTRSGSTASAPPNSAPFGAPLLPTPNRPSVSTVSSASCRCCRCCRRRTRRRCPPRLPPASLTSVSPSSQVRREQEDLDQRESEAEKRCTFKPKISER